MNIRIWIQTGAFAGMTRPEADRRLRKACQEISSMYNFTFEFVAENRAQLKVYWANNAQFRQRLGFTALGVAFGRSAIWLNNERVFSHSEQRRIPETLFQHEFGHTRGLKHTPESEGDTVMHWANLPPFFPAREAKDWQRRFRWSGQNFYVVSKQIEAAKMKALLDVFNPLAEKRRELLAERTSLMVQRPTDWPSVHKVQEELDKINPQITEMSPKIAAHHREWWRLHREWTNDPKVQGAI